MRRGQKFLCLVLVLVLTLLAGLWTPAVASTPVESALKESAAYMLDTVTAPQVGSIGGEWAVLGLARSGYDVPQEYWDDYYAVVEKYVEDCEGVLHERKYTEYSRVVVALTAIGADPRNVAGYDLLKPLGDYKKTIWQGINGPIWALVALDCGGYDVPANPEAEIQATRQLYIDRILACELDGGGWNLTDMGGTGRADPDLTGMALQALARYQDQDKVKAATERALTRLSEMWKEEGGYASWGTANSEGIDQVIVGLLELGVPLDDPRFVTQRGTLLDELLSYRQADGSFRHTSAGAGNDLMASEQGLYTLVAVVRAEQGLSSLYRMDDVSITVSGQTSPASGLPGKHADVKRTFLAAPGVTFPDIQGHEDQTAIEGLAARKIINGMGDGLFQPDATMTRAQFATIMVNALGLEPKAGDSFTDVSAGQWYAPYIGTASAYGIILGQGDGTFLPENTISRQEAAVMVARAAALCGMDTELEDYEIRNALALYGDYRTISGWASESMAFCYSSGILPDRGELNVEPGRPILRCEIARMVYNMLESARLL